MSETMIPGGRGKPAVRVSEATLGQLKGFISWQAKKLEEDPEGRFAARNREQLEAARFELARREGGGAQHQPPPNQPPPTALARRDADTMVKGSWTSAQVIDQELRAAAQRYHLVSPATSCGGIPEGCEVALSLVYVDPSTDRGGPGEVYSVPGGKLGLSGTTIKRIGAALGVDWDTDRSGRLDDGSDTLYCHFRAVGFVRNFDGSIRTLSGEVELDLRDGSAQVEAMRQRSSSEDGFKSQLRDMRLFLVRHAETKAKLRAICDAGLKRSYTKGELDKAFAVARLMATGRTDDPALREKFALMNFDKLTSGRAALYGQSHATGPARLPAPTPASVPKFEGHTPPPLGSVTDDLDDGGYDVDAEAAAPPATAAATPRPAGVAPQDHVDESGDRVPY